MTLRALQRRLHELQEQDRLVTQSRAATDQLLENQQSHEMSYGDSLETVRNVDGLLGNLTRTKTQLLYELTDQANHRTLFKRFVPKGESGSYTYSWLERHSTAPSLYFNCTDSLAPTLQQQSAAQCIVVEPRSIAQERDNLRRLSLQNEVKTDNTAARRELQKWKGKLEKLERPRTAPQRVQLLERPSTAAASIGKTPTKEAAGSGRDRGEQRGKPDDDESTVDEGSQYATSSNHVPPPETTATADRRGVDGQEQQPVQDSQTPRSNTKRSRPSTAAGRVTGTPPKHSSPSSKVLSSAALRQKIAELEDPSVPLSHHFPAVRQVDESAALDTQVHVIAERGEYTESTLIDLKCRQGPNVEIQFSAYDRTQSESKFAFDFFRDTQHELELALAEAEQKLRDYQIKRSKINVRERCAARIQRGWRASHQEVVEAAEHPQQE